MSTPAPYPMLGDVWPYTEAAAPPELAALPLSVFFHDPRNSSVSSADWTLVEDPAAAPRASYALRVMRRDGAGELARWDPIRGRWNPVHRFQVEDRDTACSVIELKGIVLGNIKTPEALQTRLMALMAAELSEAKTYRLTSKVLGVMSIMILFFSIRSGAEARAFEPFALIFVLAMMAGMTAVGLRTRCKAISEAGLSRIQEQFRFEYRPAEHAPLTINNVTRVLKENDMKREEDAVIFGFLLLLCFVYFISPLVVIGVIVALVVVTLMTGNTEMLRTLGLAHDRTEQRLEQSFLSFRAGDDALSPPALRQAKKLVLRDRIRRYGDTLGKVRDTQARFRLTQDIGFGISFLVIFTAYALPIALGIEKFAPNMRDSLVTTSLFSVAPVIVLLSISKTTVAMAQIVNRRLAALSR